MNCDIRCEKVGDEREIHRGMIPRGRQLENLPVLRLALLCCQCRPLARRQLGRGPNKPAAGWLNFGFFPGVQGSS